MSELTNNQITKKLRCIFSKLAKLEQGTSSEQVNADWDAITGPAQILNKPNYYRVSITPTGTIQNLTPLTIGIGMPISINDNTLFSAGKFTNTTNKPLLVNIDCGLSFGVATWSTGTCTINMSKNGTLFKSASIATKDSNNFMSVRLTTSELLFPGEDISFVINQNSGSNKTIVSDFQNFFNIIALEV